SVGGNDAKPTLHPRESNLHQDSVGNCGFVREDAAHLRRAERILKDAGFENSGRHLASSRGSGFEAIPLPLAVGHRTIKTASFDAVQTEKFSLVRGGA